MNFLYSNAPLREQESEAGAGAGAANPGLTLEAVQKLLNDTINGFDKKISKQFKAFDEKFAALTPKQQAEQAAEQQEQPQDPSAAHKPAIDPKLQRDFEALKRKNEDLAKQFQESENARKEEAAKRLENERVLAIKTELAKSQFANPFAAEDAFRYFKDEIKRDQETGELLGGDGLPLSDFVSDVLKKRTHWIAPAQQSGSGAHSSQSAAAAARADIDSIKPGMDPKAEQVILAGIQAALKSS